MVNNFRLTAAMRKKGQEKNEEKKTNHALSVNEEKDLVV